MATANLSSVLQVVIMFFLTGVFKVERQTGLEWGISIIIGTSAIPVALLVKYISK